MSQVIIMPPPPVVDLAAFLREQCDRQIARNFQELAEAMERGDQIFYTGDEDWDEGE